MLVFWYLCFLSIVVVTVQGEVRANNICVACSDCLALFQPVWCNQCWKLHRWPLCMMSCCHSRPPLSQSIVFDVLRVVRERNHTLNTCCFCAEIRGWLWDDSKSGQSLYIVQSLIIWQKFKYREPIKVTFTRVSSLDWSCYRNGYEFDWPQKMYGGNACWVLIMSYLLSVILMVPFLPPVSVSSWRSMALREHMGVGVGAGD
jgi:hypothetical protein